ncbi:MULTISPECIES: fluoride efflux transporter CrcB [Dehalococcoides]|uniref:Fluoride-specific ion channel FluC n=1 Tax=Dehalococcoides mccartyi (strain VS) TaxID=311424 RepID=D2BJ74_DEHMV|nr:MULTISPECIES: fluoride efflux transporter CrcB [Dehalococcoides]ACZ62374.1 camphor resistance-like protein [Dehalococcoides mccartyi VS]AHB14091.1 camphor resistance protein [Dehalococcoides mccartyi GY50]UJP38220.1 fluoride efflux transporter CrcB [Dehalococcoides mccartyi]BAQ35200.1 protein CrcB homolog [Dehalococcoides sp. UCH007]
MSEILLLAAGGALGAVSRYGLNNLSIKLLGESFPYGTLIVNCLGCFVLGFLMQWGFSSGNHNTHLKLMLTAGFLGAFTTFSTFSYETLDCFRTGNYVSGLSNILANVVLGLLMVFIGAYLGGLLKQNSGT